MSDLRIGSLAVKNTASIFTEASRMSMLCYAPPKRGKTTIGGTLDKLTKKYHNKPSLYIAVELGEGGGLASIEEMGVDYVTPRTKTEIDEVLSYLVTDTKYAGVVLDGATETNYSIVQPFTLTQPHREKNPAVIAARKLGVPARGDYGMMGEEMRTVFQKLVNLTTLGDPEGDARQKSLAQNRKHVFVTALLREKRDDSGVLEQAGPALPGQMADHAAGIFQTITTVNIVREMNRETKEKESKYFMSVGPKDNWILGDRFGLLPQDQMLPADLCQLYETYWLPKIQGTGKYDNETIKAASA